MSVEDPFGKELPDRCYYIKVGEDWIYIPNCYGGAQGGPDYCTCEIDGSQLERAQSARQFAEDEVTRLSDKAVRRNEEYKSLLRRNTRLHREIERLRDDGEL